MIIYFDTETTGLVPGRIIQLSYILQNEGGTKGKNFYFYVDYVEPAAQAVHGISIEMLEKLSCGKMFSDYIDEICEDFETADIIVGHNIGFDIAFMIAEFKGADRQFRYREQFDTMKYFTPVMKLPRKSGRGYKYPKLIEICDYAKIFPYDVSKKTMEIFGKNGLGAHNAAYDTTMTYLALEVLKEKDEKLKKCLLSKVNG